MEFKIYRKGNNLTTLMAIILMYFSILHKRRFMWQLDAIHQKSLI